MLFDVLSEVNLYTNDALKLNNVYFSWIDQGSL